MCSLRINNFSGKIRKMRRKMSALQITLETPEFINKDLHVACCINAVARS